MIYIFDIGDVTSPMNDKSSLLLICKVLRHPWDNMQYCVCCDYNTTTNYGYSYHTSGRWHTSLNRQCEKDKYQD